MYVYVGVAAYSRTPPQKAIEGVERFIESLYTACGDALDRLVFIVGGYEGLMKVFADKAIGRGLKVVILPPVEQEDQVFPDGAIVLRTGVTFTIRSSILVHASDILISFGGGVGSIEEIVTAHNEGKSVIVLTGVGLPTDVVKGFPSRLDQRSSRPLKCVENPDDLANEVCESLRRRAQATASRGQSL